MKQITFCIFTILTALIPHTLLAQLSVELDSISVTASRISSTISESGKSVSVYTQEQIQRMPITSVDELLRNLPGVNINSRNGFGVQADVGIRGSTYSQVLFMLDNVPLNDPLTGHFNANIPVSLSEIGQIELVRGPASTSFGADAVGGVVHIKTKMYLERNIRAVTNGEPLSKAFADLSLGENGLTMADASLELQTKNWRFSLSAKDTRSDGESFTNPGFSEGVSEQENYNSFFTLSNISASASHRFSDKLSWYVRGGLDKRDFNARFFYTRSIYDESVEEITNRWGLTALTFHSGKHAIEANASYRVVEDIFDFNSAISPANKHETGLLFLNASHQYTVLENSTVFKALRLLSGGQFVQKNIESTDRGTHDNHNGGIYTIATASFHNGLSTTGSLRLQFNSIGGTNLLPQLSAAYRIHSLNFRSSVGQAVRSGDFTERFVSSEIPNLTPLRNIGNPDLKPEKSTTFDMGMDWTPSHRFRFSPTFFIRSSSNLIDYTLTNSSQISNTSNLLPNEDYFYAQNIASAESAGIEVLTEGKLYESNIHSLNLQTGYTYIKTTSDQETVSRYIANHPSHQVQFGLGYSNTRFELQSQSTFHVRSPEANELVNADIPDSYFISNVHLSFIPFHDGIKIYTRILNITNTEYQEILGAPMPGRWVMGGIQLRL